MPTASERPKSPRAVKKLGGSATATNETPVSGDATLKPDPKLEPASTGFPQAPEKDEDRGENDYVHANGRDHPSQSEQPHALEKRKGESFHRIEQDASVRKFNQTFSMRHKGGGTKPAQRRGR
jgi:hypothetical protein